MFYLYDSLFPLPSSIHVIPLAFFIIDITGAKCLVFGYAMHIDAPYDPGPGEFPILAMCRAKWSSRGGIENSGAAFSRVEWLWLCIHWKWLWEWPGAGLPSSCFSSLVMILSMNSGFMFLRETPSDFEIYDVNLLPVRSIKFKPLYEKGLG